MIDKVNEKILNELCDKYGSDKGSLKATSDVYPQLPHNYNKVYAWLFSSMRDRELTIFECGIGTNNPSVPSNMGISAKPGASLRVWRDFFPNSVVYGVDIDRDIMFSEDRIVTDYMDQTSSGSIKAFWDSHKIRPNIIIDDGLHEYHAGKSLYENSIEHLADGGIYVIEDILPEDLTSYKQYFQDSTYDVLFLSINRSGIFLNDNTLLVVFK